LLATSTDSGRMDALLTSFDRISALADKFDSQQGVLGQVAANLVERLAAVEGAITAEIETAASRREREMVCYFGLASLDMLLKKPRAVAQATG
jgi:hypothetical protein